MSDEPDARGAARGEAVGAAGPFYGPVHRFGRPAVELRDGPPATSEHPWAPPDAPTLYGPLEPRHLAPPVGLPGQPLVRSDHAGWSRRVAAFVLDALPGLVAATVLVAGYLPMYAGFARGDLTVPPRYPLVVAGSVLALAALALVVGNRYLLAGRTGQSLGKRLTGIWLVHRTTGRPVGAVDAFVRDVLHVLDNLGGVGYLWPLWDDEGQTLADKVAETVVVRTPAVPLPLDGRRPA